MAHPLIEQARKTPLKNRMAAMRRARDEVKREKIIEAKRRTKAGKGNWSSQYRGLQYESVPEVKPFKHYADQVRREQEARRRR